MNFILDNNLSYCLLHVHFIFSHYYSMEWFNCLKVSLIKFLPLYLSVCRSFRLSDFQPIRSFVHFFIYPTKAFLLSVCRSVCKYFSSPIIYPFCNHPHLSIAAFIYPSTSIIYPLRLSKYPHASTPPISQFVHSSTHPPFLPFICSFIYSSIHVSPHLYMKVLILSTCVFILSLLQFINPSDHPLTHSFHLSAH